MLRRWSRSTAGMVAAVSLGFALATVGIGVAAYRVTHEALERQLDHRAADEMAALKSELTEGGRGELIEALRQRVAAHTGAGLDYLLTDDAGQLVIGTIVPAVRPVAGYRELFRFRRGTEPGVGQALTERVPGGLLTVIADRRDLSEIDITLEVMFAAAFAALLVLGTGAAALIGWLTRRRLAQIDRTALAIIGGDFGQRIPRDRSDSEFDRIAETLNRMLDRVATLMDNLRQVSSDVAHDLRTPLTRLGSQLDRALAATDREQREAAIAAARSQVDELLEIFAAILRIAEVEGLTASRIAGVVDLGELVEDLVETYRPDLEASGRLVRLECEPGLTLSGDRRLLAQALSNLLENVLRHAPPSGDVVVRAVSFDTLVAVEVVDPGLGVSTAEGERLFARFARSEQARATPGHGLGLALVKAVAEAHAGEASILPPPGFGVRLSFPSVQKRVAML